jgi:chromosome partitioning protein
MGSRGARIIAVINEKGGVGKTVTVINLGAALATLKKKVLIVDMDPQFNATKGLGVTVKDEDYTVYDIVSASDTIPASTAIVSTPWEGLDLIPSHVDLSGAELELVDEPGRESRLKAGLDLIRNNYDFIILDTPPSLSLLTVNVLVAANEVFIPCQTHPYAYAALDSLVETVQDVRKNINPRLKITGVIATFYDKRTRVGHSILEALKKDKRFSDKLFDTIIRSNITIAESAYYGKPVIFYDKHCNGAIDYVNLAKEVLERK